MTDDDAEAPRLPDDFVEDALREIMTRFPNWLPTSSMIGFARAVGINAVRRATKAARRQAL